MCYSSYISPSQSLFFFLFFFFCMLQLLLHISYGDGFTQKNQVLHDNSTLEPHHFSPTTDKLKSYPSKCKPGKWLWEILLADELTGHYVPGTDPSPWLTHHTSLSRV